MGSAITIVSELAEKEKRGYYNTIIAALGLLGAIFASLLSFIFHWRIIYFIGGILGLFFLRYNTLESEIFKEKDKIHKKECSAKKMKNLNEFFEYIKKYVYDFYKVYKNLSIGYTDMVRF